MGSKGKGKGKGGASEPDTRTAVEKELDAELAEQARHMRVMAQEAGAAGGKASIFRQPLVNDRPVGKEKFLESVPVEQIWNDPNEFLKERWGGGLYRVVLRDANGDFAKVGSRLTYEIDGPPKTAEEQDETRKLDELEQRIQSMTAKGSDASPLDMMRLLMEVQREQLRELRNPPAAAATANPMEMAVALVTSLQNTQAPLLQALIERASSPAPDMIAQMKGMAEMMLTLRELGTDKEASGWSRVADRLADPLGKLVDQHVSNQAAGIAPPHTMGGPPLQPGAQPNPPAGEAPQGPPWLQMIRPYLPQLIRYARIGRDPAVIADFVAEELPQQSLGMIYQTLTGPGFLDEFVRVVPDAREHQEWFGRFFARVLEWIEPPGASDTGSGDDDAPDDARSSKPEVGTVAEGEPEA